MVVQQLELPTLSSYGSPKVFSGARLDYYAVTENTAALRKFKLESPTYPMIGLPFSAVLDTLILPVILSVATYEFIFESRSERIPVACCGVSER